VRLCPVSATHARAGRSQPMAERKNPPRRRSRANSPRVAGVTWAKDMKSQRVAWLWRDHVAFGSLNELIADEGMGKSTVGARIGADATRGALDGQGGNAVRVLVVAEEDSWSHTVKPRWQAAGGDMAKVGGLQVPTTDGFRPVMFPGDTDFVREALGRARARLLYIDPTGSHVKVKNPFDTDEVRRALAPLAVAAHEDHFAVLGVRHTNRVNSTDARARSGGSLGYRQATRVQLILGHDPDDPDNEFARMLVGSKSNISRKAQAQRVRMQLVPVELDDGNTEMHMCAYFDEVTAYTDADVLRATIPEPTKGRGRPARALEEAEAFIERVLGNGRWMRSVEFDAAAKAHGISPRTLKRARDEMQVRADEKADGWYVALPSAEIIPLKRTVRDDPEGQ
jgi:AAA domain